VLVGNRRRNRVRRDFGYPLHHHNLFLKWFASPPGS
jgi:hypothetical protein